MGEIRAKLDCGAIVLTPLFLRVVEIEGKVQDLLLKMGDNSYKGVVYRRGG